MKFAYSKINNVFDWQEPLIPTLVIENQSLFRGILKDMRSASEGMSAPVVLSKNGKLLDFSKYAEVIYDFVNFSLNQRTLISKICAELERIAVSPEHYQRTQELLAEIECTLDTWAFELSCDITATKISLPSLIKSLGVEVNDEYQGDRGEVEKIVDYMELVREFDRDKLFVTVNMRSYFADDIICDFIQTLLSHEYKVLMIESCSHPLLKNEKRLTVDADLCEF